MNSFFGIGSAELLLVLFLAGIILGPERIAVVARKFGYWVIKLRHITKLFMDGLKRELNEVDPDGEMKATMSSTMSELESLKKEVQILKKDLLQIGQEPEKMIEAAQATLNEEEEHSIGQPPDLADQSEPSELPKLVAVEGDMEE